MPQAKTLMPKTDRRDGLFAPAIEGLAKEDVLVVLATGGRPRDELVLTSVPANVRIASMLPYAELLPRTSVMVTNGGYGGVQIALSHGVPLVVAGTTEDKPEVAARVAWSGSGINLRTSTPTAAAVRNAVREVLAKPGYRLNAQRLSHEYSRYDVVERGTASIEKLIGSRTKSVRADSRNGSGIERSTERERGLTLTRQHGSPRMD